MRNNTKGDKGMKTAIVTGIGQDGYYLSKQLLEKGFYVVGITQWQTKGYRDDLAQLMNNKNFKLIEGDITDRCMMRRMILKYKPIYFFNTASISHVAVSFEIPERVAQVNYVAVLQILEEIRAHSPETSFLQCSTSEQFGDNTVVPQDENSSMLPNSPYSIAKAASYFLVKLYRKFGLKTYNTIGFNHESEVRPDNFVSRKITKGLADIFLGKTDKLVLGNIDAKRDWGYSPDYTEAMIQIVESGKPDDYVLATGETFTVREFIEEACRVLNNRSPFELEWKGKGTDEIGYINGEPTVFVSKEFYRPAEVTVLHGSATKIKEKLGWEPKVRFHELVERLIYYDLGEDYETKNK